VMSGVLHLKFMCCKVSRSALTLNARLTLIYVRGELPPARSQLHTAHGSRRGSKRAVITLVVIDA
jgi:hypothetical protein